MKLGVSRCLLGDKVRFDGGHKLDHWVVDILAPRFELVPVCPEFEAGFGVPREAFRLEGSPQAPRMVTSHSRRDVTDQMNAWCAARVEDLVPLGLRGYIFKAKSPTSGLRNVKVYDQGGVPSNSGVGLFAAAFVKRFPLMPCEDEAQLALPEVRSKFLENLFIYDRWLTLDQQQPGALAQFHADHKLLFQTRGPAPARELGAAAAAGDWQAYQTGLRRLFDRQGARGAQTAVLQKTLGFFRRQADPYERASVGASIEMFRQGHVPLVVPLTLLRHLLGKYPDPWLARQHFLNPPAEELQLRYHP
jgi:uncharacterized protein YbbK (DUF523 family)/uncharacterized protein YbgA (DUF1722 family)